MNIEINSKSKTIIIKDDENLYDIVEFIRAAFPDEWKEFKIISRIEYVYYPIGTSPIYPNPTYPIFPTWPLITY